MFLVMVDVSTKWPEVSVMTGATTEGTIDELRNTFARWGIPQQIIADNGPQFCVRDVSEVYELQQHQVQPVPPSQYHPPSPRPPSHKWLGGEVCSNPETSTKCVTKGWEIPSSQACQFITELQEFQTFDNRDSSGIPYDGKRATLSSALRSEAMTRQVMTRAAAIEQSFGEGEKVMVRDYWTGHTR